MMALLIKLKQIQIKRKYVVYGFIHRMEKELEIPSGIIDLCIIFYGNGNDEWYPEWVNTDTITLDMSNHSITSLGKPGNAFMKRVIDCGYYEWRLKCEYPSARGNLMIGLWRVQKNKKPPLDTYYTNGEEQGYGFLCSSAMLIDTKVGYGSAKKYGKSVTDSIIDMIVDFDNLALSFKIDGEDFGKAFDITQDKYRAVVYLFGEGNYVKIL